LGIYIWNATPSLQLVRLLRRLRPNLRIVLGGPEVSYEPELQEITSLADIVIGGEADLAFAEVARNLLQGRPPENKFFTAPLPGLAELASPYPFYTQEDLEHRIAYVEASRGCPFTCEFCLSSLDIPVRQFPLEAFLREMQKLIDRGLKHFKFVDRTFNLNLNVSRSILLFFLKQHRPGRFYHFEMIPDRFPPALRELVAQFPPGSIQFEVGIQTFDEKTSELISRRQNLIALEDNLRFLTSQTGVHVHADLIVGLPGEDLETFGRGFDRLVRLNPQEIQVGILKRLRGTPITRHDREWEMVYSPDPPYEILQNKLLSFADMQRMRRFARYWDLVANSGNFKRTIPLLWKRHDSPFQAFQDLSDCLFTKLRRTDQISLPSLTELLFEHLTNHASVPAEDIALQLAEDFMAPGRRDPPECLRKHLPSDWIARMRSRSATDRTAPKRQARRLPNVASPTHPEG